MFRDVQNLVRNTGGWVLASKPPFSIIEVSGKGEPKMRSQTGKKLILESGFEYSNQQRKYNGLNNGKVYFLGERKYNKDRAFFKVVGGDNKGILETLEKFLQDKGYETQINKSEWDVNLQILNPNKEEGK